MLRSNLPRIEREKFSYAGVRIAVRLVALDYNRNPHAYADSKPLAVLELADKHRLLFPALHPHLVYVARMLTEGHTLAAIRRMTVVPVVRSLHKWRPNR